MSPAYQYQYFQHDDKSVADEVRWLSDALRCGKRIVFLLGAGVSTDAGIPGFKDKSAFTSALSEQLYAAAEEIERHHDYVRDLIIKSLSTAPTRFHRMLGSICQEGRLLRVYTQNIDGLELRVPFLYTNVPLSPDGPWPNTIQLHGSIHHMVCQKCHWTSPINLLLFRGSVPPACPKCEMSDRKRVEERNKRSTNPGALRPRILLYDHPPDGYENSIFDRIQQADLSANPDVLIVAGTAANVPGAQNLIANFCERVKLQPNGVTIWISKEEPKGKLADQFDVILKASCDAIAELVKY